MYSTSDTIVAIATPAGRGGIGVVRISGPSAGEVASGLLQLDAPLQPRHATFARTHGDQVVATYFPAPHSYTGEHVVEISAHGSPVVLRQIVEQAIALGAQARRAGRVHASRISQRPDRSRAGRGGRRSHRRRDAAAGARGVRSTGRHADRAHRRDRRRAVRSHREARGVARFSGRGLSLRRRRRSGHGAARRSSASSRRCFAKPDAGG